MAPRFVYLVQFITNYEGSETMAVCGTKEVAIALSTTILNKYPQSDLENWKRSQDGCSWVGRGHTLRIEQWEVDT